MKTLIVEDDFTSRLLLQNFLSRFGDCHIAVNGKEAVEAFRSAIEQGEAYSLICMDILMPEMNGKEAVRLVREYEAASVIQLAPQVKIIMTTGVDDIKEVISSFKELCDAYLFKPIDTSELLLTMKRLELIK